VCILAILTTAGVGIPPTNEMREMHHNHTQHLKHPTNTEILTSN
jgi:hypothetical protein